MENEHELTYETLTRVYLGSYEYYKSVEAEVEHPKPRFELQGARMDHMEQRMFALLGYRKKKWGKKMNEGFCFLFIGEWSLYYECGALETRVEVLEALDDAAAEMSHQEGHVASIWTKGKLNQVVIHGHLDLLWRLCTKMDNILDDVISNHQQHRAGGQNIEDLLDTLLRLKDDGG
ncbi:hypothetical protein Tco_1568485 [Tanacetum coccineum]